VISRIKWRIKSEKDVDVSRATSARIGVHVYLYTVYLFIAILNCMKFLSYPHPNFFTPDPGEDSLGETE
jgi:hypothetical protein